MTYTRPDMEAFQALAEESCRLGQTSEDVDQILEQTTQLYEAYDRFTPCCPWRTFSIAKICRMPRPRRSMNFAPASPARWSRLWRHTTRPLAQGPAVEELEEYFWGGLFRWLHWREPVGCGLLDLWNQEQEAVARYYEVRNQLADASYEDMEKNLGPILVELIGLRQELAASGWV